MHDHGIHENIKRFLIEHFPLARKVGLGNQDLLLTTGILDSLGVLDLVAYLEAQFGLTISDEELVPEHFQTIEHLSAFVQSKSQLQVEQLP